MTGEQIANAIDDFVETLDKKDYPFVNWGDISCTGVNLTRQIFPYDYGEHEYYEAILEECDPQNYELISVIENYIAKKYSIDIRIKCEW